MEVQSVGNNPTKLNRPTKYAIAGAIAGSAYGAINYIGYNTPKVLFSTAKTFSEKKDAIALSKDYFQKLSGMNFDKTTLSKSCQETMKYLKKPSTILKGLAAFTLVGAAIGFAIDAISSDKKSKKSQEVK